MKVLFVCTGNACRSPLAEALLKKLRPDIYVDSAGTHAYYRIVDLTRRYAQKHGAEDLLKKVPDSLISKNLKEFDLIIAMEPMHKEAILSQNSNCSDKIIVWNIKDPYFLIFNSASREFDRIRSKVAKLSKALR